MNARALIQFGFRLAILVATLIGIMLAAMVFTIWMGPEEIRMELVACFVKIIMALIALFGGIAERTLHSAGRALASSSSPAPK